MDEEKEDEEEKVEEEGDYRWKRANRMLAKRERMTRNGTI